MQALTGYTSFFLLYERKMRLFLDKINCLFKRNQLRTDYDIKVRKTLGQAYKAACNYLQLAHKRQNNYYDRHPRGKRFKQRQSVWLHTPVLEKGVAL